MHPLFTRSAREMGLSKTAHELQKGPHCQKPTLPQVKTLGSKLDKVPVSEKMQNSTEVCRLWLQHTREALVIQRACILG